MLLVLISGSSGWMVSAQDGGGEGEVPDSDLALLTKLDQQERLRVIVQLKIPGLTNKTAELNTPAIHTAQSDLLSTLSSNNVRLIHQYDYIPFMAVEVDRAGLEGLLKSPLVVGVEEDILMKPLLSESVPLINADDVWNIAGYTGEGQVVAILDTGVDKNHPALVGKVVSEACYSTNNIEYGSTSLCPGGVAESTAINSALPYINNCPTGECDHGTHVAGIVAANNSTIKGVAKGANLIAIQVFSKIDSTSECTYPDPNPCVRSFVGDQIKALDRIYALRTTFTIAAVNLSLGGVSYNDTCDTVGVNISYKAAVDLLRSASIVTVAASGNNGYTNAIASPACISTVISVGATTDTLPETVVNYSNSSEILDLLAPGQWINSAVPGNGYETWGGTSMATPHVAGAWALIRSAVPGASVYDILNAFKLTGVQILDTRNPSYPTIKPRIDVFAALQSLLKPSYPLNISASDGEYVDKVRIFWSSTENTSYYQVFRSYRNDSTSATQIGSINHPSLLYDDTSADPGVKYYYWVKACNEIYCSDYSFSNDGWRGTGTSTPSPPAGVTASDGEFENKVRITWYEVGGISYYQVFRNEINDSISAKIIVESLATWSYDDLTAERGKEYYYWVKACKTQGQDCSDFSLYDLGYVKDDFHIFLPLINKNYRDPILNGDFELGRDGSWTEYSSNGYILILTENNLPIFPKSGDWAVWLGDDIDVYGEISRLSQDVSISSSSPYLHFWYEIFSDDLCSIDYDAFKVKINGATIFSEELCYANNTIGWTEKVINLSAYSGSSVTLLFEVITDNSLFSSVFLDDVSMSSVSTVSTAVVEEMQVMGDVTSRKVK
jgi:subtilisin family serine protease